DRVNVDFSSLTELGAFFNVAVGGEGIAQIDLSGLRTADDALLQFTGPYEENTEIESPPVEQPLNERNGIDLASLETVKNLTISIVNAYSQNIVLPLLNEVSCDFAILIDGMGANEFVFPILSQIGQGDCSDNHDSTGSFAYQGFGDILSVLRLPQLESVQAISIQTTSSADRISIGTELTDRTLTPDSFDISAHVTELDISNIESVGQAINYCINRSSLELPLDNKDSLENGGTDTGGGVFPPLNGLGGAGGGLGSDDPFFCSEYDRLVGASSFIDAGSCNCGIVEQIDL
ncbi:MAG: hypothetical protein MK135_16125, partial [Polyangiaceae bacterium]|nr:hypothetical protein [Polyangiaceae bacterium]